MMNPRTTPDASSASGPADVSLLATQAQAQTQAPSQIETIAASAAPSLDSTVAADCALATPSALDGTLVGRTTVLPKVISETEGLLRLEPQARSRYTTQKRLGAGAMGEVELSEDHDIGRPVALKRLTAGHESPTAVARFVDEVRTMGSLDHPNITPIYDVGRDDDGRLFFTMKYVEGESLESIIERLAAGDPATHAKYPLARRLDIFVGVINALDYAHDQGILHRDIKPANIMLGVHGEVRLMDWGIARRGERTLERTTGVDDERPDMTQDGALLGTPLYMSPEQARGDHAAIDTRSDLYSAFVVLYELLTLRRYVQEGPNLYATLQDVMEGAGPWRDPSSWVHDTQPAIPVEFRIFLRRGLQRDPDRRFDSASEVLLVLERVRSGDFEASCPISFFKVQQNRMSSFAERRPQLFMSMMAMATVGMVGLLTLAGLGVMALV